MPESAVPWGSLSVAYTAVLSSRSMLPSMSRLPPKVPSNCTVLSGYAATLKGRPVSFAAKPSHFTSLTPPPSCGVTTTVHGITAMPHLLGRRSPQAPPPARNRRVLGRLLVRHLKHDPAAAPLGAKLTDRQGCALPAAEIGIPGVVEVGDDDVRLACVLVELAAPVAHVAAPHQLAAEPIRQIAHAVGRALGKGLMPGGAAGARCGDRAQEAGAGVGVANRQYRAARGAAPEDFHIDDAGPRGHAHHADALADFAVAVVDLRDRERFITPRSLQVTAAVQPGQPGGLESRKRCVPGHSQSLLSGRLDRLVDVDLHHAGVQDADGGRRALHEHLPAVHPRGQ